MVNKKLAIFVTVILVLITFTATAFGTLMLTDWGVINSGGKNVLSNEDFQDWMAFKRLQTIMNRIDSRYIFDYDEQDLLDGAAKGIVNALGDPYSDYFIPEEYQSMVSSLSGEYTGIGVMVSFDPEDSLVTVVRVFKDSPAQKAGVQKGDKIIGINGENVQGQDQDQVIAQVRGEAKTSVTIEFLRGVDRVTLDVMRDNIVAQRVEWRMLPDQIGYIEILEFTANSVKEFNQALQELQNENAKGLIIDVRDNPGGYLDHVNQIADRLLPKGKIFYTQYKDGKQETYYSDDAFVDKPIVLLINENSASASELLAGALRDHERATLVGKKSFGKGIVQDTEYFKDDGAGLKLTIAYYYTPNGQCIHGIGIEPDIEVELPEELINNPLLITDEKDTQLQRAIQALKEKIQ